LKAALHKLVNRSAAPRPAPAAVPMRPVPAGTVQLQSTMRVSSPRDPAEREAESTARKIMRMASPEVTLNSGAGDAPLRRKLESPYIARFADSIRLMRQHTAAPTGTRQGEGQPEVSASLASDITGSQGAGSPLPAGVRQFMEPRFGADFSKVRIHTSDTAARLNRQVSAQSFTVGSQIFFGKNQFQPDTSEGQELIAHELTHTIQQGAVQQGPAVQRREDVTVTEQASPHVQRAGLGDVLGFFADAANALPGFRLFTLVLGVNPINQKKVDRSAANILRAVVEFLPGGKLITKALDTYEVFDRVGNWIEKQIRKLGLTGRSIQDAIKNFLDSLGFRDFFNPGGVWKRAKRIFSEPIDRILKFVGGLLSDILDFIREAILRPLAERASRTRGWDLLCAVLGVNPITRESVPRTAETLIGGFMKLIGQQEIWENIKRGNAIARAWSWFQGALSGLLTFVRKIPGLVVKAVLSLELKDLVRLPQAFSRVADVFGDFISRFMTWAGSTVWDLLEIIVSVVAPKLMGYLRRAGGAIRTILQDPVRFVGHLVGAAKLGFRQFASHFPEHLRRSLIGWLTGALKGTNLYIPRSLNPPELIKFVLSLLSLTWQNIRQKLVRVIGEPAMRALETGFELVTRLVRQGPAAAWEKIQEGLSNLREMVIEQIIDFVRDRVVKAAVTRLLSMLSPAGAFIQAILAAYNTVMFFVERLQQLSQVVTSFINSFAAIAAGNIASAANRVEQTLGGMLTLVISFLARIAGLGNVTQAVTNVVNRVRQPVDRAMDRVVAWIVAQARRLGRFVARAAGVGPVEELRVSFSMRGARHTLSFGGPSGTKVLMESAVGPLVSKVDRAMSSLRATQNPDRDRLAVLGRIRALAVLVEAAEARTKTGDRDTMALLRTRLQELGNAITAYSSRFNVTDLDIINPTNDVTLAVELAQQAAAQRRLAPIDQAKISLQIERVMGPAWSNYVNQMAGKIWTLTEPSLVKAYGRERATLLMSGSNNFQFVLGFYHPQLDILFVNPYRSITEIAATIVHEGTHMLQTRFGLRLDRYEKEFQAFTVQREFLRRLARENWSQVPAPYDELLRAESDSQLHHIVQSKYDFTPNTALTQAADLSFIKNLMRSRYGT
jgi:hypothetical protein